MDTLKYRHRTKAAKEHNCDLCLETIQKGEIYLLSSMADSGTVENFREHISCGELADILNDGDEIDYDLFHELVMDEADALQLPPDKFIVHVNNLKRHCNVS